MVSISSSTATSRSLYAHCSMWAVVPVCVRRPATPATRHAGHALAGRPPQLSRRRAPSSGLPLSLLAGRSLTIGEAFRWRGNGHGVNTYLRRAFAWRSLDPTAFDRRSGAACGIPSHKNIATHRKAQTWRVITVMHRLRGWHLLVSFLVKPKMQVIDHKIGLDHDSSGSRPVFRCRPRWAKLILFSDAPASISCPFSFLFSYPFDSLSMIDLSVSPSFHFFRTP